MSERDLRSAFTRNLKRLHAVAVENPVGAGTPDVNYIEGWVELKWLRSWPKKDATVVAIDHFTQQQRVWLFERWRKGGNAYLFLQVGRHYLLFNGDVASALVGKVTRPELFHIAAAWWDGMNWQELPERLKRDD